MSTVDSMLVTEWNKQAHITYAERESKLWKHVKKVPAPSQKVHSFTVFSNLTAESNGKTQASDLTRTVATTSNVSATMQIPYIQVVIDDWDLAQTSVDYRAAVNAEAIGALWRKVDDAIITEFGNATASETTLPTANTFNFAGARKMAEVLATNNADDGQLYGVVSEGAMTDLINDSVYINNYHFQNDVIATGMAKGVAGFDLARSNRLGNGAAGATERRCYFWHEDAVKIALGRDFKLSIDWDPRIQGYLYTASIIFAPKIIDNNGLQFCDVTN